MVITVIVKHSRLGVRGESLLIALSEEDQTDDYDDSMQ